MLQNYIKIAWRNMIRNKALSAINIIGLALGLGTCLLIGLFVLDELSYDRFNEKADRMVRVVFRGAINGEKMKEAHVMPPVAQALKADYPEVQEATRIRANRPPLLTYGDHSFSNQAFAFVDSNFFQVFTLPFVQGDPKTALAGPNTLVITETAAERYFGKSRPDWENSNG